MEKIVPEKPFLIMLYGFPGAGKTYFARQFVEDIKAAHLEGDRIRSELFEKPRFSRQENYALGRIMDYMVGEFLGSGISVVYDINAMRFAQRRALREIAKKHKANSLIVWFQVDADTAFLRANRRDHRKLDDKYAADFEPDQFREIAAHMQQPETTEDFIVVSGKHNYPSQRSGVIKRLADMGHLQPSQVAGKMIKPGLVNLVPNNPRELEHQPRNIILR